MSVRILIGDCREKLRELPDASVHCCVTSPPYFGLRDYGTAAWSGGDPECSHEPSQEWIDHNFNANSAFGEGAKTQGAAAKGRWYNKDGSCKCGATRIDRQMGLEPTPDEFVAGMVEVFREVRRVLRDDGTLWLNIGDSYASGGTGGCSLKSTLNGGKGVGADEKLRLMQQSPRPIPFGLKQKDLIGIPWKLAKALRAPFYSGRIKSELDRVWLAAIMDGEGSISGFVHERGDGTGTRTGVNVCITNTCERMFAKATEIWPACLVPHQMNNDRLGTRPVYRWKPNGAENVGDFLAEIYPYLVTKKAQAMLAWNLMQFSKDGQAWGKSSEAASVREKRTALAAMISELNKGGSPLIPDWVKEPPSLHEPGWYLRQDIIWSKPNPMPESVRDRCTKAHEYLFLLSKGPRYYYDADAIAEPLESSSIARLSQNVEEQEGSDRVPGKTNGKMKAVYTKPYTGQSTKDYASGKAQDASETKRRIVERILSGEIVTRNKRSVWEVATQPFSEAHFATYPPALIEPCILAGCPTGGTVLDPFGGAGTTGLVADRLGRNAILIELNPEYAGIAERRLTADSPLFAQVAAA